MAAEQWALGGVSFNDPSNGLRIRALSRSIARRRAAWLENPDADGAVLGQIPRAGLQEIVFRLQYVDLASMDTALGKMATVIDKIEACKLDPDGVALVWTPHGSAKSGTFRALLGEVIELPIELGGDAYGWFQGDPVFVVSLTCLPFWEGTELAVPVTASWTTPVGSLTLPDVPGDAPALGELTITNNEATDYVRWLMWGSGPNAGGIIDSDALVTTGFSGAGTTRTGAYDVGGGNTVVRATMLASTTAVCGTGELTHQGTYRVLARVYTTEFDCMVRLVWQDKDGPWTANPWVEPPVSDDWAKIDLGTISVQASDLGDQVWAGRLEAYNENGGTLDVDFLALVPVKDGHGLARAVSPDVAGTVTLDDQFTSTTAGNNLNGRAAPVGGGTWATSGTANDFQFADVDVTGAAAETLVRSDSAGSFRYAVIGSGYTDIEIGADIGLSTSSVLGSAGTHGLIARWTDANNYVRFEISQPVSIYTIWEVSIYKRVAGVETLIASRWWSASALFSGRLVLRVHASGRVLGYWYTMAGVLVTGVAGQDSALATGGALDDGAVGLIDAGNGSGALSRYYDAVTAVVPPPEPIVIYPSQDFIVTHDTAVRADADSGRYGPPPFYRPAGHLYIQPEGSAARSTHMVIIGSPTDLDTTAWSTIDHSLEASVVYTPRGNAIPR